MNKSNSRAGRLDDLADDDDDEQNLSAKQAEEEARRQEFLRRMNEVRIGGHQADHHTVSYDGTSGKQSPAMWAKRGGASDGIAQTPKEVMSRGSPSPNGKSSTPGSMKPTLKSAGSSRPGAGKSATPPKGGAIDVARISSQAFPAFPNNPVLKAVSVPPSDQFPVKEANVGPQHFTRLKLLGRGGIGQVYLVQLKDTDKLYAMKVLTKEEMILRNKVKRVMTEREILATANHPFIVTMYASFQTADRLCFVMEYCAGGEFFRVLQRQPKKRLKEDAVRFYTAEVILALEYLHHMGFIYRDLKPENILMRQNGHIALTDFDLSKQAHAVSPRVVQQQLSLGDKIRKSFSLSMSKKSGHNSSLTNLEIVNSEPVLPYQTNSFVGTEEYIAPEVVNGVGQSSAVDWWTLGILIYEMLTGTTPFKGSYTDETFNNIVNEQLKWPDDLNVSNECKQLVKKLLRREADKRLGAENGASDIKRSKWFKDFNFALIRNEIPPIIPKIRDPQDLSQYTTMPEDDGQGDPSSSDTPSADTSNSYLDDSNPENPFVNFNMRRNKSLQRQY